jgi:hypothetical protein
VEIKERRNIVISSTYEGDHEQLRPNHRSELRVKIAEGTPKEIAANKTVIEVYLGE